MAEIDDSIVMTSQCYGSPDSSFKGTVSAFSLGAILFGLEHFDTFTILSAL